MMFTALKGRCQLLLIFISILPAKLWQKQRPCLPKWSPCVLNVVEMRGRHGTWAGNFLTVTDHTYTHAANVWHMPMSVHYQCALSKWHADPKFYAWRTTMSHFCSFDPEVPESSCRWCPGQVLQSYTDVFFPCLTKQVTKQVTNSGIFIKIGIIIISISYHKTYKTPATSPSPSQELCPVATAPARCPSRSPPRWSLG